MVFLSDFGDWGFWIAVGFMVAIVAALMLLALVRGRLRETPAAAYDLRVYRDQLNEVEKDLARGTITEAEAQRVRTEVSRRVLEADRALASDATPRTAPKAANWVAGVAIVAALSGSVLLYLGVGDPGQPDDPMALRLAGARKLATDRPSQTQIEGRMAKTVTPPPPDPKYAQLVALLRAAVKKHPDDLTGQELLAKQQAALGHYIAAYHAQEAVIRIEGEAATAHDYAHLAELMIYATNGYVSPQAEAQLKHALKLDPKNGTARFFKGLMMSQIGRPDVGFQIWERLLRESPPSSPWLGPLRSQIGQMAEMAGIRYQPPPPKGALPGPSANAIGAASNMSPAERKEMIRGMVEGLAERLDSKGGSPQEWAGLIRAYGVLGEREKKKDALAKAQAAYKGNDSALAVIDAAQAPAGGPAAGALPAPSTQDVQAARDMSPAQRRQFIEGMVARLNNKLATQGGAAPEWAQLIGAYGILGRTDRARAIWNEAQTRFEAHPAQLAQIRAAAVKAGVAQ